MNLRARCNRKQSNRWILIQSVFCASLVFCARCATKARTGALGGTGVGAIIGQVAGRSTEATLIGAAVGAGVGYIIGNELDKDEAKKIEAARQIPGNTPLAGTSWIVTNLVRDEPLPYKSLIFEFRRDGHVVTLSTLPNGSVVRSDESYRVVGNTLIVNKPGYIVNAKFQIAGSEMIVETPKARAVLQLL
jgi:hypothetical protein